MQENRCPNCGKDNRTGAKFCQNCGQSLSDNPAAPPARPPDPGSEGLLSELRDEFGFLAEDAKGFLQSLLNTESNVSTAPPPVKPEGAIPPQSDAPPTRLIAQTPSPKQAGELSGRVVTAPNAQRSEPSHALHRGSIYGKLR